MIFIAFFLFILSSSWAVNDDVRYFSLVNKCDDDIWVAFTPGAAPYSSGSHCAHDSDCIEGSACNTVNGICFWDVPIPSTGKYRLEKNGGRSQVKFPILKNDVVWSGNVVACFNGTCDDTNDGCDKHGCAPKRPSPVTMVSLLLRK